jgi:hypothetical protein
VSGRPILGPLPTADYLYLAGPMTGIEHYNFPAFMAAAADLRAAGFQVWNPAEADINADKFDPATDTHQPLAHYMTRDLPAVCRSRGVATLPEWFRSSGSKIEVSVALALDLPVRPFTEWIANAAFLAAYQPEG